MTSNLGLLKQDLCKNAEIIVDAKNMQVRTEICHNARRQGSAYCQQCADRFKGKRVVLT